MYQHDFFINAVRETSGIEDTMLLVTLNSGPFYSSLYTHRWNIIGDPTAHAPKTELGLSKLFSEVRATVDTEAQIVKVVFPNPPVVLQVFLQRVFAQSVRRLYSGYNPNILTFTDSTTPRIPIAQSWRHFRPCISSHLTARSLTNIGAC